MNRLAKKCVITSATLHGTLLLVLIVGPAFLSSKDKPDITPPIDFVPVATIIQALSGGGNPNVPLSIPQPPPEARPQPRPQPPQPDPEPVRPQPSPEPKPEVQQRPEPQVVKTPDKVVSNPVDTKPTHSRPVVSLRPVVRNPNSKPATSSTKSKNKSREIASSFTAAADTIASSSSGSVQVELRGPGGGGLPYAGFNQALVSTYMREWLIPGEAADSNAKVVAVITISRNGRVKEASISRRSGNSDLDASVQRALDKVTYVAPFPESVKDAEKTFWLEFDPKAKRMIG